MSKKKDQEEVSEGPQNRSGPEPEQGSAAAEGAPEGDPCASAEDRIVGLEKEIADLKDKLLRKQADFENFRKRMLREREDAARYANASLLSDLIGLIDDFERAIRSAEESHDFSTFLQGISIIEKQFVEMLETRWGLKRFTSVGEGFDPNRHEAVLRVEGPTGQQAHRRGGLPEGVLPARARVAAGEGESHGSGPSTGPRRRALMRARSRGKVGWARS